MLISPTRCGQDAKLTIFIEQAGSESINQRCPYLRITACPIILTDDAGYPAGGRQAPPAVGVDDPQNPGINRISERTREELIPRDRWFYRRNGWVIGSRRR
jgi:hypothetical protein